MATCTAPTSMKATWAAPNSKSKNKASLAWLLLWQLLPAFAGVSELEVAVAQTPPAPTANTNPEFNPDESRAVVKFRDHELFIVNQGVGSLTASARAESIERRLLLVSEQSSGILAELRVEELHGVSEIVAGDVLIRAVTDADAEGTGRTRQQLAAELLSTIRAALTEDFNSRSTSALLRSTAYAALATLIFGTAILLMIRVYRWSNRLIARIGLGMQGERIRRRLPLLTSSAVGETVHGAWALLFWFIALGIFYVYLRYTLSLFPWTHSIAAHMQSAGSSAIRKGVVGVVDYIPELFNIVIIAIIARIILKALRTSFERLAEEKIVVTGFYRDWAMPTYSIVRFFVIAVTAIVIFPYLPGSGSEGFKGVSVFLGLLVSLGAASAIANVIAGVVIVYMRPFRVGDRVKIADAVGDVMSKDLFVVKLRTIKNVDITIPNSLVLANHIVNFSTNAQEAGLILHTSVTIGYDAPWRTVHELLLAAARRVDGIKSDPAPFVLQTSLDDFYVSYELNAFTDQPLEMAPIYSRLHEEIQDAFFKAGVEIMSPHYTSVRDGNRTAIPDDYLPKNYRAPSFSIVSRVTQGASEDT